MCASRKQKEERGTLQPLGVEMLYLLRDAYYNAGVQRGGVEMQGKSLFPVVISVLFVACAPVGEATGPYGLADKIPPEIRVQGITTQTADVDAGNSADLLGHTKRVTSLAFADDGRTLVSGSYDGSVRLWDLPSGEDRKVFRGHEGGVLAVAVSPGGRYVASGGWDRHIIIWDPQSGSRVRQLRRHRAGVSALAFSSDGRYLLSGSFDGTLYVWDVESGTLRGNLVGHDLAVQAVTVSPNGSVAASAGADTYVHLWDLTDFTEIRRLEGQHGLIKALIFTPDGRFLVSGGADEKIIMWNTETGGQERTFGNALLTINALSVSPDGRRLLAADQGSVHIWNLASGERVATFSPCRDVLTTALFSPSGDEVAAASQDGLIVVSEAPSGVIAARAGWLETTDPIVRVQGTVTDDSLLARITIDEEPLIIAANGSFTHSRQVMVGENLLNLVAVDEWGNKAEYKLSILREIKQDSTARLPALNPFMRRGVENDNNVAIVIGIEKYSKVPVAEYAENDAKVFFDFATNVLGIPQGKIRLLVGEKASRNAILKALSNWLKSAVTPDESDVFMFFSGHGLAKPDGSGAYILPSDGDPALLEDTSISRERLWRELAAAKPRSVTMFLDACYSGISRSGEALAAGRKPVVLREPSWGRLPQRTSVLSAASHNEISIGLEEREHGLFSYFLMRALEGEADKSGFGNGDGRLTLDEIFAYVKPNVARIAASRGQEQNPQLVGGEGRVIARW